MDKCEFSEFTYGYCVTEDLIVGQGTSLTAAPIFPSLIDEGKAGKGYDLMLNKPGTPLFLQFKLVHQMVRRTANEVKKQHFKEPFYRMHLRPAKISDQHASLLSLEQSGNQVFYSAPAFHTVKALNTAYAEGKVWDRSFRIKPTQIGPFDDDKPHHVTFQTATGDWKVYSEEPSRNGRGESTEMISRDLEERIVARGNRNLKEQIEELDHDLINIVKNRNERRPLRERIDIQKLGEGQNPIRRIAYISRQFFDCQLLFITVRG